jgi:predicted XRE-type DNA-binding protein
MGKECNMTNAVTNPFELIHDRETAAAMQMKANMMIAVRDIIDQKGWIQADAAKNLGVSQPRISDLKKGKIDKFSADMLMNMLMKLDFKFLFHYQPEASDQELNISMAVEKF